METEIDVKVPSNRELKKKRKQSLKKPGFKLNLEHLAVKRQNTLKLKDWQNLVLWLLSDGQSTPWIMCTDRQNIRQVVVVMVQGLQPSDLMDGEVLSVDALPSLKTSMASKFALAQSGGLKFNKLSKVQDLFQHCVLTNGPGDRTRIHSPMAAMLEVPMSASQKAKLKSKQPQAAQLDDFCLTDDQLIENEYPRVVGDGWVTAQRQPEPQIDDGFTKVGKKVHQDILAIDCEMSYTKSGLALTRISVVDGRKKVLLDTFVMPDEPIIDYNTKYSGITPMLLEGITTSLKDVQEMLCGVKGLIRTDTILVGHSLENDLAILKIVHQRVIDTSVIYHASRGPPSKPSLRYLAEKYLDKLIQQQADNGHDSVIDAQTCIDLLSLKLQKGFQFGLVQQENESIFQRISSSWQQSPMGTTLSKYELQLQSCMVDTERSLVNYGSGASLKLISTNDEQCVKKMCETASIMHPTIASEVGEVELPKYQFLVGRLTSLHQAVEAKTAQDEAMIKIQQSIKQIYESMPSQSLMMVVSGLGDSTKFHELVAERQRYNQLIKEHGAHNVHKDMPNDVFDEQKIHRLEVECAAGRLGVGMLALKP